MTNADKLRQMTDEELADIVKFWIECDSCPCNVGSTQAHCGCHADCFYGAFKWLKQEVDQNDSETV